MYKALYDLIKNLGLFSYPVLRDFRNSVYARYLGTSEIVVDSFVRIQRLHFNPDSRFKIGKSLHVGYGALIDLSGTVVIGDRVTISEGSRIFSHTHVVDGGVQDWRLNETRFSSYLAIGDDVWIASSVVVLSSVKKIGVGAIVTAGSIVTKDVDDFAIVAGSPAKLVRYRKVEAVYPDV